MEEELKVPGESEDVTPAPIEVEPPAPARGGLAWLIEGARVLAFRAPRWEGLDAGPVTLAVLILAGYLAVLALQWTGVPDDAFFLWTGLLGGWPAVVFMAWLCWIVTRSAATRVTAATLLALSCGAWVVFGLGLFVVWLALHVALGQTQHWPDLAPWAGAALLIAGLAQIVLLWRVAGAPLERATAALLAPLALVLGVWAAPAKFWWHMPAKADPEDEPEIGLPLTDETIARQAQLLDTALKGLSPPQRGRVNVYAATYAPNASEDVFMRESATVAKTMRERFGADGRLVELVANRATTDTLPWGTPANLRATIARMAAVMDRDRDVLFLHLTSHGGRDGKLANDTWPLQTEPVTPALLKQWLDDAGVRWRVISVSACYSGSWIAPLAGDGTLVMTAADADHTSYGCGKRSELTFFGRAMYEEALRKTWSFTEAHAFAREVIEVREQEAGKSDGYSNPQISEGAAIRPVLERLAEERRAR